MTGREHAARPQWSLELDAERIGWLTFDVPGASANALSRSAMEELNGRLLEIERAAPSGLVILSGKSGFIAGADVGEFGEVSSPEEAVPFIRDAHGVFDRLERLPCPTVAAINGYCLGGGLELAMACRYRVCADDPGLVLGLPEVMLGIHPGFGGTVRAVRLIGVSAAMDMMLTGRNVRPDKARRLGLVDRVVPAAELGKAATAILRQRPSPARASLKQRVLSLKPIRGLVAPRIEAQVARRARRDHYPAPYAIIDLWRKHGANLDSAYEAEAQSVARLVCTPTSRNLVRVFFLQERMKSLGNIAALKSGRIHVIGAGLMGGDIAAWCALRGFNVSLQDHSAESLSTALQRAQAFFEKRQRVPGTASAALARIDADPEGRRIGEADIVIEAIAEDAQSKRDLYSHIEPQLKPGALLASNTSSIALEELAEKLADPGRFVGLHFFNPVSKMPLIEVVESRSTRPEVLQGALAFVRGIDRLPLPCRSSPGFLVNRVLMTYLTEALFAAGDAIPLIQIDAAATDFGMPTGPVELADSLGLDVCLGFSRILAERFGRPPPEGLADLVERGKLGRKSGTGLYEWQAGKAVKPVSTDKAPLPADLQDRLILPMVNEAVAILREGVVGEEDLIDAGVIFGTGFAPFRGGPLRYARERGAAEVMQRLSELEVRYGARFKPDAGWQQFINGPL